MFKKLIMAVISALMLCACGGTSRTPEPEPAAKKLNLVGDWKEDTDNSSYFYAIIAGNTIEIYIQSDNTRSLYWAGSYAEPAEPAKTYSWVSENDFTKTRSAMMASGDETKEFTYEDGVLSFYSKIMGVEATRKLKKVSDEPSVNEMKSTITVSQSELKQPELLEVGGSFTPNSNYYNYAALIRNPNENMGIEFTNYKVVVKDANGTILAVKDGVEGPLYPGETTVIGGAVDCAGGIVETIDFTVSCDRDDFVQNLSGIDSRNFYFNSLNYIDRGSYIWEKSVTGVLINNCNTKCRTATITALFRNHGKIVGMETNSLDAVQPGENMFQFERHTDCGEFDTIEFYASDLYSHSNDTVSGFTPLDGLKNENTLYFTENGVTTVKPSVEELPPETSSGGMTFAEFKSKMDSLETFFNSYAEFMKSYDSSNLEMLAKYSEMLSKYSEAMNALDEIDEASLTAEQKAYYSEVMIRINKTLMEAAVSMQG